MNTNQSPSNKSDQGPGTHDATKSDKVAGPSADVTDWNDPVYACGDSYDYGSPNDNQEPFASGSNI